MGLLRTLKFGLHGFVGDLRILQADGPLQLAGSAQVLRRNPADQDDKSRFELKF
jgi:hypothetical protein